MRTALAADHLSPPADRPGKVATAVEPRRGHRGIRTAILTGSPIPTERSRPSGRPGGPKMPMVADRS